MISGRHGKTRRCTSKFGGKSRETSREAIKKAEKNRGTSLGPVIEHRPLVDKNARYNRALCPVGKLTTIPGGAQKTKKERHREMTSTREAYHNKRTLQEKSVCACCDGQSDESWKRKRREQNRKLNRKRGALEEVMY